MGLSSGSIENGTTPQPPFLVIRAGKSFWVEGRALNQCSATLHAFREGCFRDAIATMRQAACGRLSMPRSGNDRRSPNGCCRGAAFRWSSTLERAPRQISGMSFRNSRRCSGARANSTTPQRLFRGRCCNASRLPACPRTSSESHVSMPSHAAPPLRAGSGSPSAAEEAYDIGNRSAA